jgi:hypothetical protein
LPLANFQLKPYAARKKRQNKHGKTELTEWANYD